MNAKKSSATTFTTAINKSHPAIKRKTVGAPRPVKNQSVEADPNQG